MFLNEPPVLLNRSEYVRTAADANMVKEQQAENSARTAFQHLTFTTTGTGQITVEKQMFDTTFYTQPVVTTGQVLLSAPGWGWRYPQTTSGVYRWERDEHGFYVGAYLYFVVDCATENLDDPVQMGLSAEQLRVLIERYKKEATVSEDSSGYAKTMVYAYQLELQRVLRTENRKPPKPIVEHHLLFQGVASKQLPAEVLNNL